MNENTLKKYQGLCTSNRSKTFCILLSVTFIQTNIFFDNSSGTTNQLANNKQDSQWTPYTLAHDIWQNIRYYFDVEYGEAVGFVDLDVVDDIPLLLTISEQ